MMRLLVITNNSNPNHPSFRQRIAIHLDLLRSKGMDCHVATLPASMLERRTLFASARRFDGVLLHRKPLNAWDGYWLRRHGGRVIYDFDDAIMYNPRQPNRVSRIRFHRFARTAALSRMVIGGNEYLAEHARRHNACVAVLPTGLDVAAYRLRTPRETDGAVRLVWIGSSSTLKYVRQISSALEELGRRFAHVVLRIVCDDFLDLTSVKVEKRLWSKEAETAELLTSDIGLAPLSDDSFTRGKCGFKILQYQAAGLPVVASPVGVNAHYVHDGVGGFAAGSCSQWVAKLTALIENPELRRTMGRAARREVERFDARVIGDRLHGLILECLQEDHKGNGNPSKD